jgi:hypothetical protein
VNPSFLLMPGLEEELRGFVALQVPALQQFHGRALLSAWCDFKVGLREKCMHLSAQHAQAGRRASAAAQQAQARLS